MSRTDRRPRQRMDPQRRRESILEAAGQAFAATPYQQVVVADIAAAAGGSEALVHRYFATKADLYVEVVRTAIEDLLVRHEEADRALGPSATPRERVAVSIEIYLDFIGFSPVGWSSPLRHPQSGFPGAADVRNEARNTYVGLLRGVLGLEPESPRDHALYGHLGFLDSACLAWVDGGCQESERTALVDMAVGALQGALDAVGVSVF